MPASLPAFTPAKMRADITLHAVRGSAFVGRGEVWGSEEASQRFGDVIAPVLQELDYPGQPQIFEVHNVVKRVPQPNLD